MASISALLQHFVVRSAIYLARGAERGQGWHRGIRWLPTLIYGLAKGYFQKNQQSAEYDASPLLSAARKSLVHYINLDYRVDRKFETLGEFARIDVTNPVRVAGVKAENGALGCAQSHVNVLEPLEGKDFGVAMICEDDVEFLLERNQLDLILREFLAIDGLGVLCLANRVRGPKFPISKHLALSNNIQMAACYVLKPSALSAVLTSFRGSVKNLSAGRSARDFAIDQAWKTVQTRDVFFAVPRQLVVRQRRSYSDIEKSVKFYG